MEITPDKKFPIHGWFGIILIIIFWYLNWNLTGLRTHLFFFPLWLGFILTIDAIVLSRKGSSLLSRSKKQFIILFIVSAPAWWLFELINMRTENWIYDGRQYFTDIEYALLATISFSTVMPAVFSTTELVRSFDWISRFADRKKLIPSNKMLTYFILSGFIMLSLIIVLPDYFYFLEWTAVFFILEPINYKLKNKTLFELTAKGDWRQIISLMAGALLCGFFWEMWNYHSYPKWIYNTPMVNFLHIFEMPFLGYLGYIPFSLELFSIYNFVTGIFKIKNNSYIQLA
ncbi:MAG: hypothetical protein P8X73_01710 [Ignavibacteriaceae bacterium]|jgi:hypothetical protein